MKQPMWTMTIVLASYMATATGVAAQPDGISDGKVRIGVLTDMNGPFSDLAGKGSVAAAELAIKDFVAEHQPGFAVDLVFADHQNRADLGASKAREWYDTQQVDVVVDAINSAVALAASNIAVERNKLLIVTGAGTMRLTNDACNRNTISYTWDTYSISRPQAVTVTEAGGQRWFLLTVDYALGHSIEKDAVAAITGSGGTVVGGAKHPINEPDFSSYILQAQASNAQVLGVANAGGDLANAIKAAREFGLFSTMKVVPLAASITDIHSMGLEVAQGMVLTEAFYWDRDDESRQWSQRFLDASKIMPNQIHAGTYSAVKTYLETVQRIGTDDAPQVRDALAQVEINDIFAKNGVIRDDGRMMHDMYLMEIKRPADSKAPWDYAAVTRVIAGQDAFQPLEASSCPLIQR